MKKIVSTESAPKAIGPYSQGVFANGFYFFSGQIPLDPVSGKIVDGGVVQQTKQVLKNIDALLKSQNLKRESVVKATVFLSDLENFALVNTEYAKFFSSEAPARSCVEVSRLPMDVLVEIEIIAHAANTTNH